MIAKFNPTGTHVHKGFLKIRIDVYPEPENKTHSMHYVDQPIRDYTEEELENEGLRDLVPKVKVLNPCLCHFVTVDPDVGLGSIVELVRGIFDRETLAELDDLLSDYKPENLRKVGRLMSTKTGTGKAISSFNNRSRDSLNSRLSLLEVKV